MTENTTDTKMPGSERCQRKSLADKLCHNGRSDPSLLQSDALPKRACRLCTRLFTPTLGQIRQRHRVCRKCYREYRRRMLLKHPDMRSEERANEAAARLVDGPQRTRRLAMKRRWRRENHAKVAAHAAVKAAIASGTVARKRCEDCNSEQRAHAHHEDYAKPLAVTWLCPKCHGRRHEKDAR